MKTETTVLINSLRKVAAEAKRPRTPETAVLEFQVGFLAELAIEAADRLDELKPRSAIYHIYGSYKKIEIWECDASGQRICRHVKLFHPDQSQLNRFMRYEILTADLHKYGITPPAYEPTEAEKRREARKKAKS